MARILIVDDSSLSRRMLRNILEPGGHTIVDVADGMQALEEYALHRPDIVFLDVTMRGMNGLEVLTKLREINPQAVVVMATADIQSSTGELALEAGATHVFHKPFDGQKILSVVSELVEGLQK